MDDWDREQMSDLCRVGIEIIVDALKNALISILKLASSGWSPFPDKKTCMFLKASSFIKVRTWALEKQDLFDNMITCWHENARIFWHSRCDSDTSHYSSQSGCLLLVLFAYLLFKHLTFITALPTAFCYHRAEFDLIFKNLKLHIKNVCKKVN